MIMSEDTYIIVFANDTKIFLEVCLTNIPKFLNPIKLTIDGATESIPNYLDTQTHYFKSYHSSPPPKNSYHLVR